MNFRSSGFFWRCATFMIAVSIGVPGAAQAADHRLGLVIGEANYKAGPLSSPANDAGLVAQALASDGFEVTGYADLDLSGTRRAFADFIGKARQAGPDAVVFVYLAGYGLQFNGDDFIVPVEARIARDVDVPAEAVRLSDLARDLAALPLKARVLVYDLARPHPFAQAATPLAGGLALAGPRAGSLVAFNTAPGLVAPVEHSDYGLYAEALAEMLQTKGLGIDTVFARLRARVNALSNGATVPWTEGALETPLVLLPPATDTPSLLNPFRALMPGGSVEAYWGAIQHDGLPGYGDFLKTYPHDPLSGRVAVLRAARREAMLWAQARRANVATAYWTYMRRYPRGPHFADARRGLAALPAALEPPPRFDLYSFTDLPPPRPDELALINRPFVLLDADDDAPVPPAPETIVPARPPAFYDRLPPLLAVSAGTLPLPIPLGATAQTGRIVQPDFSGPGGPIIASEGVDKADHWTLAQIGPDDHRVSAATMSASANGGSVVTQTGPDNVPVLTTVTVAGPGGGRTVTLTGADKRVIATATTLVAANGNRVTTTSGPDGLPRSIVATTSAGTILKPKGRELRVAAPASSVRPVVLPAKQAAAPVSPPLLATTQSAPALTAPPAVSPAAAPPLVSSQAPAAPKDVVAPLSPAPVSPAPAPVEPAPVAPLVPSPALPVVPAVAMPTIVAPAPPPLPSPAALAPPPPAPEPPAVAEPVPPRREPEAVKAKASAPEPRRDGSSLDRTAQPTPPQRPKAIPVTPAPVKAKPVKAARDSAKTPPKKPTAGRRAAGKHRR